MNAIMLVRHGNPYKAFATRELPDPEPGLGEVRIAVETSGLNFADVLARKGVYQEAPRVPCILGYDVVGTIDKVGNGVRGLAAGMRVVAMTRFGGYASMVIARTYGVAAIPDSFDSAAATALGTQYTTAWYAAMEMVLLHPGDRVLIHSAGGGVGTALVQLVKLRGCVVFGTTRSRYKLHYLSTIGVDFPLCTTNGDVRTEFLDLSHGRGADVIFDSLGGMSVRKGLRLLSCGGRIVCYGVSAMCGKRAQIVRCVRTMLSFGIVHPAFLLLHSKSLIGINLLRISDERPDVIQRCLHSVVALARDGKLRPQAGRVFSSRDVADAHEMLESGGSMGKLALQWIPLLHKKRESVNAAASTLSAAAHVAISRTYTPTCEP